MRYSLMNGLLLLAIPPFTALGLPVDPNNQAGQWDPSGQYRKGHYDSNGHFIPNEGSNQVGWNENGQNYQNGQNWQTGQNGNYENGQWRGTDWNQNNDWNRNGQSNNHWQRRSLPSQFLHTEQLRKYGSLGAGHPNVGARSVNIPGTGIHARGWPYDQNNHDGWTDSNGQWHQGTQNDQGGWTDDKGVWHQNNQNGQNTQNGAGWTDAKGVWHSTDYSQGWTDANGVWHNNPNNSQNINNRGGWTDANGQWHANQKRDIVPGVGASDHYDNYREQEEPNRRQEHEENRETAEDVTSALLPGPVVTRNYPQDQNTWNHNDNDHVNDNNDWNHNVPQANPVASYNGEAHDDDGHRNKDHHKDKGINATAEKLEKLE